MNKSNLYPYQLHAIEHIIATPGCGLFMDMGLGKSVCTLTAVDELLFDRCEIRKVLVIAPKRVADEVWTTEAQKWDHLRHLRISKVLGKEHQRKKALKVLADIYVINRENVVWLIAQYGMAFPFDLLVIDELSSFKSATSARFKALRQIRPLIARVVGLTGTPAPNSLLDLWSEVYLLDRGERLSPTLVGYRQKYFVKNEYTFGYTLNDRDDSQILGDDICEKEIYNKISDICISMKAADYLDLPPRINRIIPLHFPSRVQDQYNEFEKMQVLALEDAEVISAVNAAGLCNKLLQFANGAVYDAEGNWYEVHKEKLEALDEIIDVANGQPVLVFYSYRHDAIRIKDYLKKYGPVELKNSENIKKWNEGKLPVMMAHPASAGHGLNLQAGGNIIVWFGMPWSLELYQQANARLDRQGQTKSVIVHHLVAAGTMDEDVLQTLEAKDNRQEVLLQAIKARIGKYISSNTLKVVAL